MTQHILETCESSLIKDYLTLLYEDNATCIAQAKKDYIKGDRIKHISLKSFNTREFLKSSNTEV